MRNSQVRVDYPKLPWNRWISKVGEQLQFVESRDTLEKPLGFIWKRDYKSVELRVYHPICGHKQNFTHHTDGIYPRLPKGSPGYTTDEFQWQFFTAIFNCREVGTDLAWWNTPPLGHRDETGPASDRWLVGAARVGVIELNGGYGIPADHVFPTWKSKYSMLFPGTSDKQERLLSLSKNNLISNMTNFDSRIILDMHLSK